MNFAEAVDSSGGSIIGPDGKPTVNSPEAAKGLGFLVDAFKDGTIPKGAITWQEEQGRQAFQNGTLIFHRNWRYVYALASKTDGSSKIVGKFAAAPLPGLTGPGIVQPGRPQLGDRHQRREQGHGGGLDQVHGFGEGHEVQHLGHWCGADARVALRRCRRSTRSSRSWRRP